MHQYLSGVLVFTFRFIFIVGVSFLYLDFRAFRICVLFFPFWFSGIVFLFRSLFGRMVIVVRNFVSSENVLRLLS